MTYSDRISDIVAEEVHRAILENIHTTWSPGFATTPVAPPKPPKPPKPPEPTNMQRLSKWLARNWGWLAK